MIPIITSRLIRPSRPLRFLPLPVAVVLLTCASCSSPPADPAPPPSPPVVTDTEPLGEGLKVIGYAVLGSAVVMVLGRMLR